MIFVQRIYSTLTNLRAYSVDDKSVIFLLFFFFQKTECDFSCKLPLHETSNPVLVVWVGGTGGGGGGGGGWGGAGE